MTYLPDRATYLVRPRRGSAYLGPAMGEIGPTLHWHGVTPHHTYWHGVTPCQWGGALRSRERGRARGLSR